MNINMTAQEIADTIANAVTETTGLRCETFTDGHGKAVIIADHTRLIARITPCHKSIETIVAPFTPDAAADSIPSEATSISGMRELATHLDDAIAHAIAAATRQ